MLRQLIVPGVLAICSGRAEHGLREVFSTPECEPLFGRDGLPPMTEADVRAQLIAGLDGKARLQLIGRDEDDGDGARNAFVVRVTARAQGLPLYVRYVIEDLRAGRLTVTDEDALPDGLVAYYEALLARSGLSAVRRDLPLLVCLLARAIEPLDDEALAALLAGGAAKADRYRARARAALNAASALVRQAPTSEGVGVTLYHHSFREHLNGRAGDLAPVVREAEELLAEAGDWWTVLPEGGFRNHILRNATRYDVRLGAPEARARARARLFDPSFMAARLSLDPNPARTSTLQREVLLEFAMLREGLRTIPVSGEHISRLCAAREP